MNKILMITAILYLYKEMHRYNLQLPLQIKLNLCKCNQLFNKG